MQPLAAALLDWHDENTSSEDTLRAIERAFADLHDPLDAAQVRQLLQQQVARFIVISELAEYDTTTYAILRELGEFEKALRHIRQNPDRRSRVEQLVALSLLTTPEALLTEAAAIITNSTHAQHHEDDAARYMRIAEVQAQAGNEDEARRYRQIARVKDARRVIEGHILLAVRYHELGDADSAAVHYLEAQKTLVALLETLTEERATGLNDAAPEAVRERFQAAVDRLPIIEIVWRKPTADRIKSIYQSMLDLGRCAFDLGLRTESDRFFEAAQRLLRISQREHGKTLKLVVIEEGEAKPVTYTPTMLDKYSQQALAYALLYARRYDEARELHAAPWQDKNDVITRMVSAFIASDNPIELDRPTEAFLKAVSEAQIEDGQLTAAQATIDQMNPHAQNLARLEALCNLAEALLQHNRPLDAHAIIALLKAEAWDNTEVYARIGAVLQIAGEATEARRFFALAEQTAVSIRYSDHKRKKTLLEVSMQMARAGLKDEARRVMLDSRWTEYSPWVRADTLLTLLQHKVAGDNLSAARHLAAACTEALPRMRDDVQLAMLPTEPPEKQSEIIAGLSATQKRISAYGKREEWGAVLDAIQTVDDPIQRLELLAQYPDAVALVPNLDRLRWYGAALSTEMADEASSKVVSTIMAAFTGSGPRPAELMRIMQAILDCGDRDVAASALNDLDGYPEHQITIRCLVAWDDLKRGDAAEAQTQFRQACDDWTQHQADIRSNAIPLNLMQLALDVGEGGRAAALLDAYLERVKEDHFLWGNTPYTDLNAMLIPLLEADANALIPLDVRVHAVESPQKRAGGLLKLGIAYARHGDTDLAEATFEKALSAARQITIDYSRQKLLLQIAARLAEFERTTLACALVRNVMADGPESLDDNIVRFWLSLGDIAQATAYVRDSVPPGWRQERAYAPVIKALLQQDRWAEAFGLFGKRTLGPLMLTFSRSVQARWRLSESQRDDLSLVIQYLRITHLEFFLLYLDEIAPFLEAKQPGLTQQVMLDAIQLVGLVHPDYRRLMEGLGLSPACD